MDSIFTNLNKPLPKGIILKIFKCGVIDHITNGIGRRNSLTNGKLWPDPNLYENFEQKLPGLVEDVHHFYFGKSSGLALGQISFILFDSGEVALAPHVDLVRKCSINCLLNASEISTSTYSIKGVLRSNKITDFDQVEESGKFTHLMGESWLLNTTAIHGIQPTVLDNPALIMLYGWYDQPYYGYDSVKSKIKL